MSNTTPSSPATAAEPAQDENLLIAERRDKLKAMRQQQAEGGGVTFPNDIQPSHRAAALFAEYAEKTNEELDQLAVSVHVAGLLASRPAVGKK